MRCWRSEWLVMEMLTGEIEAAIRESLSAAASS
jgi:hypothetical protein